MEFEPRFSGDCFFFNTEQQKAYNPKIEVGYLRETGTQAFRIDPEEEQKSIWEQMKCCDGPYVLYHADRDYYDNPKSPDRN